MSVDSPKDLVPKFFGNTATSYDGIANWATLGKDKYWKNEIDIIFRFASHRRRKARLGGSFGYHAPPGRFLGRPRRVRRNQERARQVRV